MNERLGFDKDGESIIDIESEDISELEDSIDAELNSIFAEIGSDKQDVTFKIRVDKVIEGKGEMAYCFACLPSELPIMDRIRDNFGSGKYQIRVWKIESGKGARLIKKPFINIMSPINKPKSTTDNNTPDMAEIMRAVAESNRQTMEQVKTMLTMNQPAVVPAGNPLQMLIDLAPAIAAFKGLFPAQTNNMDMMVKGMEMMKELQPETGGGEKNFTDFMITAAKEFGGPIMEVAKTLSQQPAQPVPVVMPGQYPPNQSDALPVVETVTPAQPENDPMYMLKMQVNNLVNQAAAQKDPALYADLILDNMPENQIREFLGQPNLKDFLIDLNPAVSNYWLWFETLQREVLAGLTPVPEQGNTSVIETSETGKDIKSDASESNGTGNTPSDT